MALTDKLKAIADAIRGKTGKTEGLTLDQMPAEIACIESGGGGGSGFTDGNLLFSEHIVTVEEGNGVTNHANLLDYFYSFTGKTIMAYSLIGIADTHNQPICGAGVPMYNGAKYPSICYRYRNGYISIPQGLANTAYDAALVVGTQYKVYCVERNE